ncbi:hypothetical protein CEUSTIGMA_g10392.t1 [Chlamydomonas eustigma]|uniref:Protein kinase domain-containing protein n=1 Tax=Chlamydomonas eustigma TaxID=1157962 RepID=A0A250XIQ8_9CHLO|nr:hypothetical protein CEUSTIGMA_g10392.t1 [Chlamydomonas eustigma]|eukprot:GAX82965.1 hypothetical protein CEUSTIGMA_g10392.t1 [Chlamydomonas eustigma]
MFQGTKNHMAPEIFREVHISKAADVYAFGITLWELYTSKKPFTGINPVFIPYQICQQDLRPSWPLFTPRRYVHLAQSCWKECPSSRPDFGIILEALQDMRAQFEATNVSVGEGRKHNTADLATLVDPPNTTKPAVVAAAGILAFKGLHQLQCPAAAACSGQQTTGCSSSSSSKEVIVFI